MTESRKRAIINFSTEMVKSKFNENSDVHGGVFLSIVNSDTTFRITTYGGTAEHYLRLVNNLELDLNE